MATTAERNARLDQLEQAVKQYAAAQRKQLTHRVDTCKRILRGRTGADRLAQASVQQASGLVVTQINEFLTG
jgi:hypothetical protein